MAVVVPRMTELSECKAFYERANELANKLSLIDSLILEAGDPTVLETALRIQALVFFKMRLTGRLVRAQSEEASFCRRAISLFVESYPKENTPTPAVFEHITKQYKVLNKLVYTFHLKMKQPPNLPEIVRQIAVRKKAKETTDAVSIPYELLAEAHSRVEADLSISSFCYIEEKRGF